MPVQFFYVYITASRSRVIYTGVNRTNRKRIWQHKQHEIEGFTKKYKCDHLVYFETFVNVSNALYSRERDQGCRREKKIALIEIENPTWENLAEDWYRQ